MHAAMSSFLKDATAFLSSYLSEVLPSLSEHWWNEHVLRDLIPHQQRIVKEKKIHSLSGLDLAALLRVLDRNWHQISERKSISSDAHLYIKEMKAVRNRWAHPVTEEPLKDDIYRDLDTLQRFARIIKADEEFIERVKEPRKRCF